MPTKFRFITDRLPALRPKRPSAPYAFEQPSGVVALAEPPASVAVDSAPSANIPRLLESGTEQVEEAPDGSGFHSFLKSTDYWFNVELSRLEKEAIGQAERHAQAGLPRQDTPVTEELPAEVVLRARATELFLEWSERAKRKVQDGIQVASVKAGESLLGLRHAFDQLEVACKNEEATEHELKERRAQDAGKSRSFEYGSLLSRKKYFSIVGLLVAIDWIANVPVFQQLLPQEPGAEKAWLDLIDRAGRYGLWEGFYRAIAHIMFAPEVSLLALGVVTLLMFLGHVTGASLRRLIAFRPKDESTVVFGLRSHRRQARIPLISGLLGIALVLGFLFHSRAKLADVTTARMVDAQHNLEAIQGKLDSATKANLMDQVQTLEQKKEEAQELLDTRTEGANYAQSITGMNGAIFLLNMTLVIVAAVGSYLESHAYVNEARLDDPGVAALEAKLSAHRSEVVALRQSIRHLYGEIQNAIGRARYLAQCMPLRDWEAKARRLEAVVPLFRTENARQRGIDVQNILAFQRASALELPILPTAEHFDVPAEIEVCEQDFSHLRTQVSAFGIQR